MKKKIPRNNLAYHYFDSYNREIFHVPEVFYIIEFRNQRRQPRVILDPSELNKKLGLLKRDYQRIKRKLAGLVEIPENDLKTIIDYSYQGELEQAKEHCLRIYHNFRKIKKCQ